jgi:hypothetical protein
LRSARVLQQVGLGEFALRHRRRVAVGASLSTPSASARSVGQPGGRSLCQLADTRAQEGWRFHSRWRYSRGHR